MNIIFNSVYSTSCFLINSLISVFSKNRKLIPIHLPPNSIENKEHPREIFTSYRKIMKDDQLRSINLYLPSPIYQDTIQGSQYTVYKAKDVGKLEWNNEILKRLVFECRKRFKSYYSDDITLLDKDDQRSSVYITHVSYQVSSGDESVRIEKWYSLRFIFIGKNPHVLKEDLDFYINKSRIYKFSSMDLIKEKLYKSSEWQNVSDEELRKRFITISRFCSTNTYTSLKDRNDLFNKHYNNIKKKLHGGISLTLMNLVFLDELKRINPPIELFIAQMHKHLTDTVLSYPSYTGKLKLPLETGYKFLKVDNLCIDRERHGNYIYSYPGYFLNNDDLMKALKVLIKEKKLSKSTIERYLNSSFDEIKKQPKIYNFHNFGRLLTKKGKIRNESITGEQLRDFLNKNVKDGPQLRLVKTKDWKKGLEDFIKAVQNYSEQDYV
jgi:hypothetical protein